MRGKFKPSTIVVDYQRERHEADARRTNNEAPVDDASGLFTLFVWALSTGLFLTAFYVASEAPLRDKNAGPADMAVVGRPGLTMTHRPAPRVSTGSTAEAIAGTQTETRR